MHAERFDGAGILQRQRDFGALRETAVHAQHAVRRAGGERALAGVREGGIRGYEVTVALRNSMMLMRISLRM